MMELLNKESQEVTEATNVIGDVDNHKTLVQIANASKRAEEVLARIDAAREQKY